MIATLYSCCETQAGLNVRNTHYNFSGPNFSVATLSTCQYRIPQHTTLVMNLQAQLPQQLCHDG